METNLSPYSSCPLFKAPPFSSQSLQPKSSSWLKPICYTLKKQYVKQSFTKPTSLFSQVHHGFAALAISLALNFFPIMPNESALASKFDVLNDGPPKETYIVDDVGVLNRVTKSDLKRLLSDLESRKGYNINFVTVRKLISKADAFKYVDQVPECWYPTVEEGTNKGIVVLVTSQKEGTVTGGPDFVKAVGDTILDATVLENLPSITSFAFLSKL